MMGSASLLAFFAILCAFTSNAKPLDDPYEVKPYEKPAETYEKPAETYDRPEETYEKPAENYEKPPDTYEKPYQKPNYVYTTPKYYEGQTVKSEYEKPESFQKFSPSGIKAPQPDHYYETEKPYKPIELAPAPNVSYYLPDYKPPNPEVPVVQGIPSVPEKTFEVQEIPYERKPNTYTIYYTTTTTTTTTTYTTTTTTTTTTYTTTTTTTYTTSTTYTTTTTTYKTTYYYTTTEAPPHPEQHIDVKPEYKEAKYPYENLVNPEHEKVPKELTTYSTTKYETPKYKPNSYVPDHDTPDIAGPYFEQKPHQETYVIPTYKSPDMEPTSYPEKQEALKYEITPGYNQYEKEEKYDASYGIRK